MRSWLPSLICAAARAAALWIDEARWADFRDGRDMQQFVTRPELKAPRYMVAKHSDNVAPGYWFVTPYTNLLFQPSTHRKEFAACMTGPHIYDGDGELIWSGACIYDNRNVFNFRPVIINGSTHFTFYLPKLQHDFEEIPARDLEPSGVLMDDQYQEVERVGGAGAFALDGHEFRILDDGVTVLISTMKFDDVDASTLGQQGTRWILNTGFQEQRLGSPGAVFEWDAVSAGIPLTESCDTTEMLETEEGEPLDYFHINSVDKFASGDYLISARHTSTIYRISKEDGHIVWRLGGCSGRSDFELKDGVPFFWQHHARVRSENETHILISLFDNHSEDGDRGEPKGRTPPTGKILILDNQKLTAELFRRFDCPDGSQSPALGSLSLLGDDIETAHVFIDWAYNGYISEYDEHGRLLLEARFVSDRKRTYRAYKGVYKGEPLESPILVILPLGHADNEIASALHVSWNGATEVAFWTFYGSTTADGSFAHLATVERRGFETSWVTPGLVQYAFAEASDIHGQVLGRSARTSITPITDPKYRLAYPTLRGTKTGSFSASGGVRDRSPYLIVELFALVGLFTILRRLTPRLVGGRAGRRDRHTTQTKDMED